MRYPFKNWELSSLSKNWCQLTAFSDYLPRLRTGADSTCRGRLISRLRMMMLSFCFSVNRVLGIYDDACVMGRFFGSTVTWYSCKVSLLSPAATLFLFCIVSMNLDTGVDNSVFPCGCARSLNTRECLIDAPVQFSILVFDKAELLLECLFFISPEQLLYPRAEDGYLVLNIVKLSL